MGIFLLHFTGRGTAAAMCHVISCAGMQQQLFEQTPMTDLKLGFTQPRCHRLLSLWNNARVDKVLYLHLADPLFGSGKGVGRYFLSSTTSFWKY